MAENREQKFAETIGGFINGVIGGFNHAFVKYNLTMLEFALILLSFAEMNQGLWSSDHSAVEGSILARAGGHIVIFVIGLITALIYAKEWADIGKAVDAFGKKKGTFFNIIIQTIQAIGVTFAMISSVVAQGLIVLSIYGVVDGFWEQFNQNPFKPLWGMAEYGAFPLMTIWVAYFHFLILFIVGLKQFGTENYSKQSAPAAPSAPAGNQGRQQAPPGTRQPKRELYDTLQRYDRSLSLRTVEQYFTSDVEAELLNNWVKSGGSQRDKAIAVLEYVNITSPSSLLNRYKREIEQALGNP